MYSGVLHRRLPNPDSRVLVDVLGLFFARCPRLSLSALIMDVFLISIHLDVFADARAHTHSVNLQMPMSQLATDGAAIKYMCSVWKVKHIQSRKGTKTHKYKMDKCDFYFMCVYTLLHRRFHLHTASFR